MFSGPLEMNGKHVKVFELKGGWVSRGMSCLWKQWPNHTVGGFDF